jgi:hypothetical protein
MHCDVERSVLGYDPLSTRNLFLSSEQTEVLIESGRYKASTGSPYRATHFRRSLDDGSCLHLVIEEQQGRLHWDAFDPHGGLFSLGMHLAHEARSETVSTCAMALRLVKLLAR